MATNEALIVSDNLLDQAVKKFQSNDVSGAIALYEDILKQSPKNFTVLNNLAIIFFQQKDIDNSRKYAKLAFSCDLDNLSQEEINSFAYLLSRIEEYELSLKCYEKSLSISSDNEEKLYEILFNAGKAARELKKYTKALEYFLKAEKIVSTPTILSLIGEAYKSLFQQREAFDYISKAIALGLKDASAIVLLGEIYITWGEDDKAYDCFMKAISIDENIIGAYLGLSVINRIGKENKNFVPKLEQIAVLDNLSCRDRSLAYFALGRIYDKLKDYDKAFLNYKLANDLLATEIEDYKYNSFVSRGKRSFSVFTKDFINKKKHLRNQSRVPIFIFGMPRSGTTLTGQILSSHSKVVSIGEKDCISSVAVEIKSRKVPGSYSEVHLPELINYMSKEEIVNLGDMYLEKATKGIDGKCKIVNSIPTGVTNLGFAAYIFPNAKIVHCKRHPLDTCLSIYFQNFITVEYSCNMGAIVLFYKHYVDTMKYWHEQLPGRIYDSYYEELLLNQEEKSRDLIKNCGLPWEDNCLQFHEKKSEVFTASSWQVRQKIYTSSMYRFKNYEKYIEPLKVALAEEIAEYESQLEKRLEKYDRERRASNVE